MTVATPQRTLATLHDRETSLAGPTPPPFEPGSSAGSGDGEGAAGDRERRLEEETAERLRIVIADDNDGVRTLLRALLSLEDDFELVGEAADGRQAVELVRECAPDLVLLDMAMPELDGLQVLERIDVTDGRTRVVVYTGFTSPEVERTARELGATDVVVKGTDPTVLIDRLREASG